MTGTIIVKVPTLFWDHFTAHNDTNNVQVLRPGRWNIRLSVGEKGFQDLHDFAREIEQLDELTFERRFEYIEDLATRFKAMGRVRRSARAARLRMNQTADTIIQRRGALPWDPTS